MKTEDTSAIRPKMLILSFSEIINDARVLKQVNLFRDDWAVTTCGFGPAPEGVAEHLRVPDDEIWLNLDGRLITLKQYQMAYSTLPGIRAARRLLKGRKHDFQVVLANEPEAVPVALGLSPGWGVHADLHEYTPSLYEQNPAWNRRIKPYFEWLVGKYVRRADSWSSPSDGVGAKYLKEFGFEPTTVANAAPHEPLSPSPVGDAIRFVHHGGAQRNRRPDVMIQAFMDSKVEGSFDLFLTGVDPQVRDEAREMAEGDPRVSVHDGIPYAELISTLNDYDVGIHILPPVNYNNLWALPNKLYDFIQARLGQIIGPNPEMARIVEGHSLGVVTEGYDAADLTRVLDAITVEDVRGWKKNAHGNASLLSAESEVPKWASAIEALKPDSAKRNASD